MAKVVKAIPFGLFAKKLMREYDTIKANSTADGMRRLTEQIPLLVIETEDGPRHVQTTADLDREMLMAFIESRRAAGRAENTILGELGRLKALCNYAVRMKVLEECPFVRGETLIREEPAKKLSHLAIRQLADLMSLLEREIKEARALDHTNSWRKRVAHDPYSANEWRARRLRTTVITWALTGARKCEVLYLWKADVDLDECRVVKISPERKRLKTPGSFRRVPIVPQLEAALREWLPCAGPSEWLFPGARMVGPWVHGSPGYKPLDQVKKACERAGIAGGHIHLFRHTWLTHAESWGIPETGAQKITGITQKRTLGYYKHTEAGQLHAFVRGLSVPDLLRPQSN